MTEAIYPPWFEKPQSNGEFERDCHSPTYLEVDNDELLSFYENVNPQLGNIRLGVGMTHDLATALTKTLLESLFHEDEWKELASALGFKDLNEISYYAQLKKAHPFYNFLTIKLRYSNLTWDYLVRVLIEEERLDLLEKLQPFITDIIANTFENMCNISEKCYNNLGSESDLSVSNGYNRFTSQVSSIEDNTQLVSRGASPDHSESSFRQMELQRAQPDLGSVLCHPRPQCLAEYFRSANTNNEISVFISHTDKDYELAAEVADKLRDKGFVVFVQGDQDGVFALDECLIVKKIVKHLDFFVPLVTKTYLRQIDVSSDFDDSRLLVRYLFYNFQSQFVDHQCVNRYIKPLVVEDVDKRKVKKHVELRCAMILWRQFDKFCNLLVDTKRINQMFNGNS